MMNWLAPPEVKPERQGYRSLVHRIPLTYKVFTLVVLLAAIIWPTADWMISRNLRELFLDQMRGELDNKAAQDRHVFDQLVQNHHRLARFITAQSRFSHYIANDNWEPRNAPLEQLDSPPAWLPDRSIMRSFFGVRFAILLDQEGDAREVYRSLPTAVPAELLHPSGLLRKLSHNQSYLTSIDGLPYALAAESFTVKKVRGSLLLASPIDEEFLYSVRANTGSGTLVALVAGTPPRVVASSDEREIAHGTTVEALNRRFLIVGKSFFDYGASDLEGSLVSMLPTGRVEATLGAVLSVAQQKRTYLIAGLLFPLLLVIWWIAARIRRVTATVETICNNTLGSQITPPPGGDEVAGLTRSLEAFAAEIVAVRAALRGQAEARIASERAAMAAERKLHDFEQLRAVTEALGVGVIIEGRTGPSAANRLMDCFAGEFGGLDPFMVEPPAQGEPVALRDTTGRERFFRVYRPPISAGKTRLVEDVTREVELERERCLFGGMPAESPSPILRIDGAGQLRYANRAAKPILKAWNCQEGDEIPDGLRRRIAEVLHSQIGKSIELAAAGRDYLLFVTRLESSDFIYLHATDVTEQKAAEAALVASEARFRVVLEAAPDAILLTDRRNAVLYANGMAQVMFGHAPDSLTGRPFSELVTPGRADDNGPLQQVGVRTDGSRFPVEISSSPVEGDSITIIRDVTEKERAAQEIRTLNETLARNVAELTDLNRELEAFSYSVSHDLRGPLRAIDGFSRALVEDFGNSLNEDARRYLDRICSSTVRMADMIDGLLRLSRVSRAELRRESVDPGILAQEVIDRLQAEYPERQVVAKVATGFKVQADRELLTVVVENLLANAWKFSAQREVGRISFGAERQGVQTIFRVRDNGAGFDMADAGRLFTAFQRLHSQQVFPGSGIGLATVARIVRRHGGKVWAQASPEQGAAFYFTLSS